ncbi:MAG: rod shape-determining protein RodA [Acidimicrobiales bacterium]
MALAQRSVEISTPSNMFVKDRYQDFRNVDFVLVLSTLAMAAIGTIMVYYATRAQLVLNGVSAHYFLDRQAIFVCIGIVLMFATMLIDYRHYESLAPLAYGGVLLLLLAVITPLGSSALGSQRWFQLGPVQVQPSEVAILGVILAVSAYFARDPGEEGLAFKRVLIALVIGGIPTFLVMIQPDLGSAIVMGIVLIAMVIVGGIRMRHLLLLAIVGVASVYLALHVGILKPYQMQRLLSFIHPTHNVQGAAYNLAESKAAIGHGGLMGTGLGHGAQTNLGFVPSEQTDFIFTAVGEQLGFVGGAVVIGLFALIIWRILRAAQRATDTFGRLLCAGVVALLAFSVFENTGMTVGIMPIAGIPLPLMSYGGSAMLAFFVSIGLALNVGMRSGRS